MELAVHGGDVRGIVRARGRAVDDFLDFSANINPSGPPAGVRDILRGYADAGWLGRYPEPGLPDLRATFARVRGVESRNILVHAGSAALFDVILRGCAPRRLGLCVPAFAEYARAARANTIDVRVFPLDAGADAAFDEDRFRAWVRREAIDAVILTNPHNPLGFALSASTVHRLRSTLAETTFIIDEAFADYDETISVAREAAADERLIVVRSVTKFYAIPDLRVGYAIMTERNALVMTRFVPAWPVSGIAAAAVNAAVTDQAYATRTRSANARGRATLRSGLMQRGLRALPAAANFITFETMRATALVERLVAGHGIILRDCSSFAGLAPDTFIRVAVRNEHDNARLLGALDSRAGS